MVVILVIESLNHYQKTRRRRVVIKEVTWSFAHYQPMLSVAAHTTYILAQGIKKA